jgi:hypothetical protein
MPYALFWDVTQHIMVVRYRCFRTTYGSHLQGPSSALCSNFKVILSLPSAIRFFVSTYKVAQGYYCVRFTTFSNLNHSWISCTVVYFPPHFKWDSCFGSTAFSCGLWRQAAGGAGEMLRIWWIWTKINWFITSLRFTCNKSEILDEHTNTAVLDSWVAN